VEAAGGLCLSRNETGVVCIPQHTGELCHRERKKQCREATILLRTREVKVAAQEPPWFPNWGKALQGLRERPVLMKRDAFS